MRKKGKKRTEDRAWVSDKLRVSEVDINILDENFFLKKKLTSIWTNLLVYKF